MKRFEKGFILYGAGKTGKVLADEIEASNSNGIQLEAFIDKNLSGTYRKTPIFQIEKVPNSYKSLPVVISIHNPDVNLREIEEKLVAEGWDSSNIIRLPEFYLMMKTQGVKLPEIYWLSQFDWMGAEDRIESARDLFLDSRSLEIFDAEMLYRTTGRWSSRILDLMDANVYLPSFFKGIKEINFVDGGAFDGDTIEDFVKHDISFREIYCFEPDSKNRNALEKRIKRLNLGCPMTLFPLGLNDTFEMLKFEESGKASSAFSENGNICIQTVPLDRILKNKPISYIKMDIEGSELNALKGCEDIISKNHPLMAICVYHRPEHLWEVPLFLKSLNKNYHFFLRLYTQNCFETVCYALDDETLSQFQ